MDILVMEIKLAINMWKQIPEIANQFEDLEYFVQQGGKKFYRHWCIPSLMVSWYAILNKFPKEITWIFFDHT